MQYCFEITFFLGQLTMRSIPTSTMFDYCVCFVVLAAAVVFDGRLSQAANQLRCGHEATHARAQTNQELGERLAVLRHLKKND